MASVPPTVPIGKLHGPGAVSRVPELFAKAAAYTGLTPPPASGDATSQAPATGFNQPRAPISTPITEDELRFYVVGLASGIPQVQRYIADNYCMPDVEFMFLTASARGRDGFYYMYRAATTLLAYKMTIREVIISQDRGVVMVDLKVRLRALPWMTHRSFPCAVFMHFAVDPADGRTKVSYQHDHHSCFLFYWMGGVLGMQLAQAILLPLGGLMLVNQGKFGDWLLGKRQQLCEQLGWTGPDPAPCPKVADAPGTATASAGPDVAAAQAAASGAEAQPPSKLLDACIRQATAEASLSMVEDEDVSAWEGWGILGLGVRAVGAVVGLWVGCSLLALSFTLNFLKPIP